MAQSPEVAFKILERIYKEIEPTKEVTEVGYRPDYMDYMVYLNDTHHCEIREKLIDGHIADPTNADIIREIKFRLQNPMELDEFEVEDRKNSQLPPQTRDAIDDPNAM